MPSRETLRFDQVLYGWSEATLAGQRGFGIYAASPGARAVLQGGDQALGPLVSYPDPGPGNEQPPPHGGFAVLRGQPVLFRRIAAGTDAFGRPGNYTVQLLVPDGFPLDAHTAAGLLASDWLTSPLPGAGGGRLDCLELAKPGPRRGSRGASATVCGAVLQGLRENRRVVIGTTDEAAGRAALCDAVRRLPASLAATVTFSTLEASPGRSRFTVALAVQGWYTAGDRGGALVVDAESGAGLDEQCQRWGAELAAANATALRGIPEPVTADAVGLRLDALLLLRKDPQRLTPDHLISVLTSPDGQQWAARREARDIAAPIIAAMDPALAPALAKAAQRRPAVTDLLRDIGWSIMSSHGRATGERLLLGLGEQQSTIDLEVLRAMPDFGPQESARYLRLLRDGGGSVKVSTKDLQKVVWTPELMRSSPQLWFSALVGSSRYRGERANATVAAALTPAMVGPVLVEAKDGGMSNPAIAQRVARGLPAPGADRTAMLTTIARAGDLGLGLVFDNLLQLPDTDPEARDALVGKFWPAIVTQASLPAYFEASLQPASQLRMLRRRWTAGAIGLVAASSAATWGVLTYLV